MVSGRRSSRYSIDYIIKFLFFLLVPVIILDLAGSFFIIDSMRRQTVRSLQDTTALYVSQIDTAHISVNKYLMRLLTENEDTRTALESEDNLIRFASSESIHRNVDTFLESFDSDYQIFLYNTANDRMYRPTELYGQLTKSQVDHIEKMLRTRMRSQRTSSYSDAWTLMIVDSQTYFYKFFHTDTFYAGCFISAEELIRPLKDALLLNTDGFISLTSKNGIALTNKSLLDQYHISFSDSRSDVSDLLTSGSRLIVSGPMIMSTFQPRIILNKFHTYERIIVLQFAITGVILVIAVLFFASIFYMKKKVLSPIKEFSEQLSQMDDNGDSLDLNSSNFIELEQVNQQFKNLLHQIRKLKIDIYEKELDKQRTMMNYLQLQIRPHFFLNCLNTIYSMAQTQLYEEIMEMSMVTSQYFRYIFRNTQDLVPLEKELLHVEHYMQIQKLRFGDCFSYQVHAEEGTGAVQIPPILIQTFIENSIKHAGILDDGFCIRTDVSWAPSKENEHGNIQIQISDSGEGFPPDVLELLNTSTPLQQINGHRIGITNAIQRLQLLYPDDSAAITFSNLSQGGACVTILLPASLPVA